MFPVGDPGSGKAVSNTKRSTGSRMEIKMIFVPKVLSIKRNARMMQMMFKISVMTESDSGMKFTRTTASPVMLPLIMWFGFMKK